MEQRPLRLGDLVDDYCPRERRVTNHARQGQLERHAEVEPACDHVFLVKMGKRRRNFEILTKAQ